MSNTEISLWKSWNFYQRLDGIRQRAANKMSIKQMSEEVGVHYDTIKKFCSSNGIKGLHQGAQPRNKNAIIHGRGRNTIMRLAQRVVMEGGRATKTCERCGLRNPLENFPIHHKDRNRSNNEPTNLEIVCHTCHNLEHNPERPRGADGRYL